MLKRIIINKIIVSTLVVSSLLMKTPVPVMAAYVSDSNSGVLKDAYGNTRNNYSDYDPNAEIKYETDTYFYIKGLDADYDVSLEEIARATGKDFNSADTISGFDYNNPKAKDSVELNDIIDTIVYMGHGDKIQELYESGNTRIYATSYNTIRAYDARTGDSNSGKTYGDYELSLRDPDDKSTKKEMNRFLSEISWGDKNAVKNTALYKIDGYTDYMPDLTKAPEPTASGSDITKTPIPTKKPTDTPVVYIPTDTPTPLPEVGIKYYGNGADGGSTWNSIMHYGGTFSVSQCGYYKNGYHFAGFWTTNRQGTGTKYYPGDKVSLYPEGSDDEILYLYAVWDRDEQAVVFDYSTSFLKYPEELDKGDMGRSFKGGETVNIYYSPFEYKTYVLEEDSAKIKTGEAYILPEPAVRGYDFINWSYRNSLSGNGFFGNYCVKGAVCTTTGIHTLYAVWKVKTYKITFDYNFDTGTRSLEGVSAFKNSPYGSDLSIDFGSEIPELPKPERTGYTFTGWRIGETNGNGSGEEVKKGDVMKWDKDLTLYASWEPVTVKLFLDGTEENKSIEVTYGKKIGEGLYDPLKTGYSFEGWNTDASGAGDNITKYTISNFYKDTHLFAVFSANEFEVTTDKNWYYKRAADDPKVDGISCDINEAPKKITLKFGDTFPRLPVLSRKGYVFAGWYTDNGNGFKINSDTKVTSENIGIIKAKWIPEGVKVIYDYNNEGDSDPENDITDTKYNAAYDLLIQKY